MPTYYRTGMPTYYSTVRKHNCHAGWNQHSGMPVTFYPRQQNFRGRQTTVRRVLGVNLELELQEIEDLQNLVETYKTYKS